jgi:hypothetical protein
MNVLDASRIIHTAWRTNSALSDAGQDVGLVVGFLHELTVLLDILKQEQGNIVVVLSEYPRHKKELVVAKFNRFFPRSEKELLANYTMMKQFLFTLFDSLPMHAINSKNLTDFECVRILQELHVSGERLRVFAPFEEFDVLRALPGKDDLELFGDDFIKRSDTFSEDNYFLTVNSPLYYALFGGRFTHKNVHFQKRTVVKLVPEVTNQIIGLGQFFDLCSKLETKIVKNEVETKRKEIEKSYAFYCGYERIRDVHLRNVAQYLSQPKKFNEAKFMVSIYKLGIVKHLKDDLDMLQLHFRRLSEH